LVGRSWRAGGFARFVYTDDGNRFPAGKKGVRRQEQLKMRKDDVGLKGKM